MGETREQPLLYVALFAASAALQWGALAIVPPVSLSLHEEEQEIEILAIEETPPAAIEEPPPPEVVEPAPEAPRPIVRRDRPVPPPPVPPPPADEPPPEEEPPPAQETIEEFAGVTLTNDTGDGWASQVGSGASTDGPIGQPGIATGRFRDGRLGGAVGGAGDAPGPRVVAFADLSRRPSPRADLDSILHRNYPARARQLGIEGHVVVRFRIMPDGSVTRVRVRSEDPTEQGFADACRRTVEQGEWEPPLASDGQAVATEASFECEFAVGL
jgi:protein TonB